MTNYLIPMNKEYKNKHYPNGFLEGADKNTKSAATVLQVLGVVLCVLFIPLIVLGIRFLIKGAAGGDRFDVTGGAVLIVIGLVFVVPAVFCFLYGKKHKGKSRADLLSDWAKKNNYTQNMIQDYVNQVLNDDTYILHIAGEFEAKNRNVGVGFLTRDFLALNGAIMKREDILAVYLVNAADTIAAGSRIKPVTILNIAVCAKNGNVMSPVKKEAAEELISMLLQQNPNITTKQESILTEKEYRKITQELSAAL